LVSRAIGHVNEHAGDSIGARRNSSICVWLSGVPIEILRFRPLHNGNVKAGGPTSSCKLRIDGLCDRVFSVRCPVAGLKEAQTPDLRVVIQAYWQRNTTAWQRAKRHLEGHGIGAGRALRKLCVLFGLSTCAQTRAQVKT